MTNALNYSNSYISSMDKDSNTNKVEAIGHGCRYPQNAEAVEVPEDSLSKSLPRRVARRRLSKQAQFAQEVNAVRVDVEAGYLPDINVETPEDERVGFLHADVSGDFAKAVLSGSRHTVRGYLDRGFARALDRDLWRLMGYSNDDRRWTQVRYASAFFQVMLPGDSAHSVRMFLCMALPLLKERTSGTPTAIHPWWARANLVDRLERFLGASPMRIAFYERNPAAFAAHAFGCGQFLFKSCSQPVRQLAFDTHEEMLRKCKGTAHSDASS